MCVCRYVHLCVCMGFDGHVTVFMSMFCAHALMGVYVSIYVVEVCVTYVIMGGCLSMYLNTRMYMSVSFTVFLYLFHVSTLKSVGPASPIHTYRAPSSAQQEKAHRPQQQSLNNASG